MLDGLAGAKNVRKPEPPSVEIKVKGWPIPRPAGKARAKLHKLTAHMRSFRLIHVCVSRRNWGGTCYSSPNGSQEAIDTTEKRNRDRRIDRRPSTHRPTQ